MKIENVAVAKRRLAAGQPTSPLLGVVHVRGRWQAVLNIGGTNTYFGTFDDEKDAGLAVDWALKNILGRPDDVNYDDAGEPTGNDPRRLHLATRTANLVGNANQASERFGVSKHGNNWRAALRIPVCQLDNKGKEIHSLPLPVCPTVETGGVCACKTIQIKYPNSADEDAAARLYDSRVRRYGLDLPPHNKPTNFAIE